MCQKHKRAGERKAELMLHPVITEPFESVAFDIVSPFPRSKSGYKYLLTYIFMASRYPDAIPLKSVTAEDVAEGMLDIFSRTGLPKELLTDRGTQFVSALVTQLCNRLHIDKMKTSPYHPQTNACIERMHGTLSSMIRKSVENKLNWHEQVKYALFALRISPNRDSGFSPFEIIFGKNVRTPLEFVNESWILQGTGKKQVVEWVEDLDKRLDLIKDILREKMGKAK